MTTTGSIIELSWVILAVYWTISSFFQKKTIKKSSYASIFMQFVFMIIPLALLIRYDIYPPLAEVLVKQSFLVDIISIIICILGLTITIWARITLGRNWSDKVVLKEKHELVKKGPYSVIRHPIYTGLLLMFLGTALAVGRIGGFVGFVILLIGFWIKLKQEENLMTEHFGKEYTNYKKHTNALTPKII